MTTHHRPYKCTIQIALPSNQYAQHLKDIISVDQEISDKVVKSFAVVDSTSCAQHDTTVNDGGMTDAEMNKNDMRVLQINFEATDAKMLRVSISTTYDMINVGLKCFQEFGG